MVEISKSGSGEGPGGVIPWGYSTMLLDPEDRRIETVGQMVILEELIR